MISGVIYIPRKNSHASMTRLQLDLAELFNGSVKGVMRIALLCDRHKETYVAITIHHKIED